jgi:hypothetical protein
MLVDILKLFKDAILIVEVMWHIMKWEDNHEWYFGKD